MASLVPPTCLELVRFRHRLGAALGAWLAAGLLLVVLLPSARGAHEWIGSLPFWLIGVPACALLVLQREAVAKRLRRVPSRPRRARRSASQARRTAVRAGRPQRASLAALLTN